MLLVGLEEVRIGIMKSRDDETIDEKMTFILDGKNGGPTEFNIQNLSSDTEQVYGGDMLRRVTGRGNGQISATFNADDIPSSVLHAILGYKQNENKIWKVDKNTISPYCSVEVKTHDGDNKAAWLGLTKGQFSRGDVNPQTNTEKQTDATDSLTFTGLNRNDGVAYVEGLESEGVTQETIDTELFGHLATNNIPDSTTTPTENPA